MIKRKKPSIPFVGLHAHSVAGSPFDGLGYPQEHMDFAFHNGNDALALTDHGNMNGLAYQVLHAKKMRADGKDFKPIFGVEAYFIPSLSDWKEEYERIKADKKNKKHIDVEGAKTIIEDESASKKNTKNILNDRSHLILLAQNQEGLNNIFSLTSKSFQGDSFYRYPRIDYEMLKAHSEGVIATSACLGGVYAKDYWKNCAYETNDDTGKQRKIGENKEDILRAMRQTSERMREIFGDRWYAELQWNSVPEQHSLNKYIIQMHKEFNVPLISTADSHYPTPDSWKDRELYKRLGWLGKGNMPAWLSEQLPESVSDIGYELYPKNGDDMWTSYKRYSEEAGVTYDDNLVRESIESTYKIAHEKIARFEPDNKVRLPDFVVPDNSTATQALTKSCANGLKKLGLLDKDYLDRLREELNVIDDRGFSKYFLTMKAIADNANEVQLTGPGRGSAAGSLVAYVLGITQIDPIKYGLLFSRFLRRDTKDYPDIDYDVSDPMELKEILMEKWGKTTVVPISNFNTLKLRSLIKDISKLYSVPFTEVNAVTSRMLKEATPRAKEKHGIKAGVYVPTFEEVMEFSDSLQSYLRKYPQIADHINVLHGQTRSLSRHAGGVVVGENLDMHMPLINSGGVTQTPWSEGQNVRHLEPMGFIKFDILGLSTLKMIECAISHILKRHHNIENPTFEDIQNYYNEKLHPDKINLTDSRVYTDVFHKGKWAGIFQFTEGGAQNFCKRAKPKNIINIAAITAIYRPGPLSADVDKLYVEAKENPGKIKYGNDIVKEVTKETYGFLIFQEQIALLAHKLGKNISLDEGNILRKLLTKKGTGKGEKEKRQIHKKFIDGCVEKGIEPKDAQALWDKFEYFSGYGFNKSHAVSYSVLSYQCAYLFHYYPAEWTAAFLDKEPESRKEKAINIAKKYGFNIRPLDINKSGRVWEISEDSKTLIQPLTSVKGLGEKAIDQILENRPFNTIEELLFNEEVVYSKLNKRALDVLVRSQTLNNLMDSRFTGLKHFWSAVAVDRPKTEKKFYENIELYKPEEDFTVEEKIEYLSDLTGIFPINMVMTNEIKDRLSHYKVPPLGEWDEDLGVAWFIPREVIEKKTKNGKNYWILRVVDDTSTTTHIKCWGVRKGKDIVHLNRPYMAKLNYSEQWGFSAHGFYSSFKLLG